MTKVEVKCPKCKKVVETYNADIVSSGGKSGLMCSNCKIRFDVSYHKAGKYDVKNIRNV